MIKNDLVNALSEMDYCKNQASIVINDIFKVIAEALVEGEKVTIRGFGTFEVKTRKGHLVQDVHTKQQKMMDDYQVIVFKPGDNLKDAVKSHDPGKLTLLSRGEQKNI